MDLKNVVEKLSVKALVDCNKIFNNLEKIAEHNQKKVLKAFIDSKISERHINFHTSGYGYEDIGRDALDNLYARYFGAESALVRASFVSGTHALTVAMFGILRPKDEFLCITGKVYDTLNGVIDYFKNFNIGYRQLDLTKEGYINFEYIKNNIKKNTKIVYIQKSRGYSLRPAVTCKEIEKVVEIVKNISKNCVILVDNCYGEFVEKCEPTAVGADLVVGSLIKNPGGGIAKTGGYIVGKKYLVNMCAERLTVPGIGREVGCSLLSVRDLFLGFFYAPSVVKEALKVNIFATYLFEQLGYEVFPKYNEYRADIVAAIILGNRQKLIKFCQAIQNYSPIDSFLKLEPWKMPGYEDEIVMASGSFTSGSSIEISADAPLRNPFAVYLQGGLNFYSGKFAVIKAAEKILDDN